MQNRCKYYVGMAQWHGCRALSAKFRSALKRNLSEAELCLMRARILAQVLRSSSGLRSACGAIANGADMAVGFFAMMTFGAFERLERVEARRGRELAVKSFHQWLSSALEGGARQAHRWTNRPNVTFPEVVLPGIREHFQKAQHHRDLWADQ